MTNEKNNYNKSAQSIQCFYHNKYEKTYWLLIEKFNNRQIYSETFEKHHPIPKSIWNDSRNTWVINVTKREHFILHLLTTKMIGFDKTSLSRFILGFDRGKNVNSFVTNLKDFWIKYYDGGNLPKKAWEHTYRKNNPNFKLWEIADYIYWVWKNVLPEPKGKGSGYSGNGYRNLAKALGEKPCKPLRTMVKFFRSGWIPEEDSEWIERYSLNLTEK